LEENRIIIQQAYYGEVDRAHSCICQTINDPELTSFLITFTDRPGALPPGVKLTPYLSGVAFSKYYIFTKTFSDPFATRAGMVFTHAVILKLDEIYNINKLDEIFALFIDEVLKEREELNAIIINISSKVIISFNKFQPQFIQQIIYSMIKGEYPILFSGNLEMFILIIQLIWNIPNAYLRKKIKFRTSFTPADIEGIDDITIVSIQKEFLSKWNGDKIILSTNKEIVEITSHSEALFLGNKEENPFYSFITDLNVDQSEFQNIGKCDKVFNDYISIDNLEDADIIRQDIRLLSKLSSSANDGGKIKEKFIIRLEELLKTGKDSNLKALRNIEWKSFSNGETKAKQLVSDFIKNELRKETQSQTGFISELLDISFSDAIKNWWHISIQESFKLIFTNCTKPVIRNAWKLIDYSNSTLNNFFSLFSSSKENEFLLRENIPLNIKKDTLKALEIISKNRKWYLLHSDILLKYTPPENAIIIQLEFENTLKLENSLGVKYLSEKLTDKQLIALTLSTCDNKLIQISIDRISKNKSLLKDIDVSIPCWLDIWSSYLELNNNISSGIEGNERKIIYSVLDLMVNDKHVPEIIIDLISNSIYADISGYKSREKCWSKIPSKFVDSFIDLTSNKVLNNFLLNKIDIDSIENPLSNKISSDGFMTSFLNEHRNNIDAVIKVYETFLKLKDNFFSDYITYYRNSISEAQSIKLGTLVNNKNFSKTARSIYDKSKYNSSFRVAFEHCRELVNLKWWEGLWSHNSKYADYSKHSVTYKQDEKSKLQMIKALPTVVILTAIQEEYSAVRKHLKDIEDVDQNDTSYEAGIFEFNGKDIAKVIIRECGAKNTIASQESERAIRNFRPDCMFFVGIAGSRKPNDFSVGDVIFPEKIYSYEAGKSEKEAFLARPDLASITFTLMEIAKKERRKNDWKTLIKNDWKIDVKANLGIIASGEQIIEHYESEIGKILTTHYNDTSAVEMEGFGFAKAATRQGRATSNIMIGVVRGISDIIEQPQEILDNAKSDRRPDDAKKFASDTAAAFTFWLIFKTYEN